MICRGIYLGEVTFNEGAPEATKYLEAKNENTLSYYKSQKMTDRDLTLHLYNL